MPPLCVGSVHEESGFGVVENRIRFLEERVAEQRMTAAIGSMRWAPVGSAADMKDLAPIDDHGHAVISAKAAHSRSTAVGVLESRLPFAKALVHVIHAEDSPRHIERRRAMMGDNRGTHS